MKYDQALNSAGTIFYAALLEEEDSSCSVGMLRRLAAFTRALRARGYDVAWGEPSLRPSGYWWELSYRGVNGGRLLSVHIFSDGRIRVQRDVGQWEDASNEAELDAALVKVLEDPTWRRLLETAWFLAAGDEEV